MDVENMPVSEEDGKVLVRAINKKLPVVFRDTAIGKIIPTLETIPECGRKYTVEELIAFLTVAIRRKEIR